MGQASFPSARGKTSYVINCATFRGETAVGGSLMHRFGSETQIAIGGRLQLQLCGQEEQRLPCQRGQQVLKVTVAARATLALRLPWEAVSSDESRADCPTLSSRTPVRSTAADGRIDRRLEGPLSQA